MASFGVGDTFAIIRLVIDTYRKWSGACRDYANSTIQPKNLKIDLSQLEKDASNRDIFSEDDAADLQSILRASKTTVRALYDIVDKFESLGSSRRRNWDRLRYGQKQREIESLQRRLQRHQGAVDTFKQTLSLRLAGNVRRRQATNQLSGAKRDRTLNTILHHLRNRHVEDLGTSDAASVHVCMRSCRV